MRITAMCTCIPRTASKTLIQPCLICQKPIKRNEEYYSAPQGKFHWEHFDRALGPCPECDGGTQVPLFGEWTCGTCAGSGQSEQYAAELRID
jgi:hypothetical protein